MIVLKRFGRTLAATTILSVLLLTTALASGGRVAVVTADALRLRAEPNLNAPILAVLSQGSQVSVVSDEKDGWYEVLYRDQKGFMSSYYLEFSETDTLLAYVNTGGSVLNLRSGPGTTYEILDKVPGGSILTVTNAGEEWHEVSYNGNTAYVSSEHVRLMTQSEYDSFKSSSASKGEEIAAFAQNYLGCRYVYGGNGPSSFDCSGFTKYIYGQFGYTINRTASDQLQNGVAVEKSELQPGDLVFFNDGYTSKPVSHVGLYIGDGDFIHASTSTKGVRIDNLNSGHYEGVYVYARRIL